MSQLASFVVVANRLPVDRVTASDGSVDWRTSPGGLVTALEPVMRQRGGAWIGWHGAADEQVAPFEHDGYSVVPVPLSAAEYEEYYEGFSNATLWPLYHDTVAFPEFHREWWDAYVTVNRRFAEAAAEAADEGATVWVQDYQLQLVPQMLRELRPDLRVGFFLHIPFPPIELFLQLPWRTEILEGLLGADLVGFQVPGGAANFLRLVRRQTGLKVERDRVQVTDSHASVSRAYPISIDTQGFADLANTPEVIAESEALLEELGHPKRIFLGVDRLDYTKGLRQRIRAMGELFEEGKLNPAEDVFLQVATPSRERVEEYKRLRDDIDLLVGRINSEVGGIGRPAIVYRHAGFPRQTMAAMYRIADVMVVTPLRDGMNLVAKEYVACHPNTGGALVLSEFAGAALELKQAYLVNPYDLNGMKAVLMQAATDPLKARERRMRALKKQVKANTIDHWADAFLGDLAGLD
ncbi:trehalose-6-phosphate synthase [Tessaracoccus lapidicaptus]|uniref:Trehalose-6-phosphate synthase n=1 Tax=Tessaracoccus lapidicaptus TaxID=1427523 RepID=A0A1C0AK63_9ACTN|nr:MULTISPECIES: trehalose-6-phosphate synthase [Tessaracoccus]AQX17024.1 trehalose-6-phosphate synthase [Tessaracoccus sp. T2.5-30]OCL32999.1 trehalose-6-phosphate synthase [Tessaracoccus lapidicaptus]VEP41874.1 Trehalose-6-phosphate synthase [Tessaracoccus lapidicaptus]